jgi:hypothetical protein
VNNEIGAVIKSLPTTIKIPVLERFTVEFYHAFKDEIMPFLLK